MGETTGRMNRQDRVLPPVSGGQEQPEKIREGIEETRTEMSETIDAIEGRLSPQRLKEEAKHTVREQTVGRAEQMVGTAQDKAEQAVSSAQHSAKSTGSGIVQTIKQNPMPAALVGVGLGWLVIESRGSSSQRRQQQTQSSMGQTQQKVGQKVGQFASEAEHKAGQMTGQAQQQAQHLAHQAQHEAGHLTSQTQQRVQQAKSKFDQMLHENPVAVGAVALGLGAAVGLAIPETRKEDQLMGDARDSMVDKAQQKAQDTMHKAEHVAEEAAKSAQSTAKQEAKKQHLTG